jgi:hypothetical protein
MHDLEVNIYQGCSILHISNDNVVIKMLKLLVVWIMLDLGLCATPHY